MHYKVTLLALAVAGVSLQAWGGSELEPEFIFPVPGEEIIINALSDNGAWGVAQTASNTDGDIRPIGGRLLKIGDPNSNVTITHSSGLASVADVTDDGRVVVGSAADRPAYWSSETKKWTLLKLPATFTGGELRAVTPDGRYAVGMVSRGDEYSFWPVAYDLTTGATLSMPKLPTRDISGYDQQQNALTAISPDGRYVLGSLSTSYLGDCASYVYDRETDTYKYIGFRETSSGRFTPEVPNLNFIDGGSMSPNGRYVGGFAYMAVPIPGSEFAQENYVSYVYDIQTQAFKVYDAAADVDVACFSVTNEGTVLAGSPAQSPASTCMIRRGKYYYSLEQILKQVYGIDLEARTGFSVSGKPCFVTSDSRTFVLYPTTSTSYVVRFKEDLLELCSRINLLGDYSITPAEGSRFATMRSVAVTFGRNVELAGDPARIELIDASGAKVRGALSASVEGNKATISFRSTKLEADKQYTVKIPAGMFAIAGDTEVTSKVITVSYTGRENTPVAVTAMYPEEGAAFARLDATSNPMLFAFDADLALTGEKMGALYREGDPAPLTEIAFLVSGDKMMAYPVANQYLFSGSDYRVEIPAGVVTDLTGSGLNEAITVHYKGTYVRTVQGDSKYLFRDECNNFENVMVYEGDHNKPADIPQAWGFQNGDQYPWWVTREDENSTDMCFTSHSMYSPAGKSDDWLCVPQIFVPDDKCYLVFDAQSYLASASDSLKVVVYESDELIGTLTSTVVERMRSEGKTIYNERQSPGASEDKLSGDWRHNVISLEEFAGKNVYIAFVNENRNQSAVFVDNIEVMRDVKFLTSFTTAERVVGRESVKVEGVVTVTSEIDTYKSASLVLKDGAGTEIDRIERSGLELGNGSRLEFAFEKELPLTVGKANKYSVGVTLGDETVAASGVVKNLAFSPTQKVVLEEFTGATCGNCPLGIVAIENLEHLFGERFIPLTLRCYNNDKLGIGVQNYAAFLNLQAAPSGVINRSAIYSPMAAGQDASGQENYFFSAEGVTTDGAQAEPTWLDIVRKEFDNQADAQISAVSSYDEKSGVVRVECTVMSALDMNNQSISLFGVVSEDKVETYQYNYFYQQPFAIMGEWGKDGAYAKSVVYPYMAMDVARGAYGTTFNGTGGLIPSTLEAGKEYKASIAMPLPATVLNASNCKITVMMIDANTNRVINADRVALNGTSGVEEVVAQHQDVEIATVGDSIVAAGEGRVALEVYDIAGRLAGRSEGEGSAAVALPQSKGIVIARAVSSTGATKCVKISR